MEQIAVIRRPVGLQRPGLAIKGDRVVEFLKVDNRRVREEQLANCVVANKKVLLPIGI